MSSQSRPTFEEFPAAGPVNASVRIPGGTVIVNAEDTAVAAVAIRPYDDSDASRGAAENTVVQFTDGRLRVEAPENGAGGWIFRRHARLRVELRLPRGSAVRAQLASADLHTEGSLGDVTVHSASGDVYVTETSGDLSVESSSGDVRADLVHGALRAETASGDVTATTVMGSVSVQTASGDVEIDEAHGSVSATTASGDIRIGVARGHQVRIKAASGDVSVGVPAGTRVWLDLGTMSGTTKTDLDMTAPPPAAGPAAAQLNLQAHTMSGDISVRRVIASHADV